MARRTADLEIDGVKYFTTQYPATKGHKLLIRLVKMLGKSVTSAMSVAGENILDAKINGELIGAAIEPLLESLDENTADKLVKDILETTDVIDEKGKTSLLTAFDVHFAGRYGHLYKVLKEVLAFQYGNFFGVIAEAKARLRQAGGAIKAK